MIGFSVGYAWPTSRHATDCGARETGCFVVTRNFCILTGERLWLPELAIRHAFESEAMAQNYVDTVWHRDLVQVALSGVAEVRGIIVRPAVSKRRVAGAAA